jgi:hypothetical protein
MNVNLRKFTLLFTACLFACPFARSAEQDNWYLHGPIDDNLSGVFHQEYDASARKDMLYKTVAGVGLEVRDINGTLLQTINTGGITFTDIEHDQSTSRLFGINASKLTCFEQNSSGGWSEQWRSTQSVSTLAQGPSGKLYCANNGNKIYVFEQNGTMSNEFGWVDGIDSLSNSANVIGFAPSGTLVVRGLHTVTGGSTTYRTFYFKESGEHIRNWHSYSYDYSSYLKDARISPSGILAIRGNSSGREYMFHPDGATLTDPNIRVSLWLQNGDFISGSNLYRRTFRTKMETSHNSVPQPVIHRIAQRAGTNIIELDFEVIDTDDDNVTVGILAYCGSDRVVPQAWLNYTGDKIGVPINTNVVHSMEWDVKQDWNASTGDIKFEILCQDGSRDKPVDLHFLQLPFEDGNMTISRSPLKDSDFFNYQKFLIATGVAQLDDSLDYYIIPGGFDAMGAFKFTNCGKVGKTGPSQTDVNNSYLGTTLENLVTVVTQGVQEWTIPETGEYYISAIGASGGHGNGGLERSDVTFPGHGAFISGKFSLNEGQKLKIVVGQKGADGPDSEGAGGGGGTFVWLDGNSTPLIVAGGGGGAGEENSAKALDASIFKDGMASASGDLGGTDGSHGTDASDNEGFGGSGWLSSGTHTGAGKKFIGGDANRADGGFGGGGGGNQGGGGGGGYSGGGGGRDRSYGGGGGGSFNSGSDQSSLSGISLSHGSVYISPAENFSPGKPNTPVVNKSLSGNSFNMSVLLNALGTGYRLATSEEVTKAREAATPGGVNNWTATNQVKPRNLPGSVNEYGFDVSTTSGYWVIKE